MMKSLDRIASLMDGSKSYILVASAIALWAGLQLSWWSMAEVDQLFGLLGLLGLAAARSAIKKI